jgi:hypothetical protein
MKKKSAASRENNMLPPAESSSSASRFLFALARAKQWADMSYMYYHFVMGLGQGSTMHHERGWAERLANWGVDFAAP